MNDTLCYFQYWYLNIFIGKENEKERQQYKQKDKKKEKRKKMTKERKSECEWVNLEMLMEIIIFLE